MAPAIARLPLVPEVLAVEIPQQIETELVRVDVRNGDGLASVRRDLPDLFQVRVEDVPAGIHDDADARVREERGRRHHQKKYQSAEGAANRHEATWLFQARTDCGRTSVRR